MPTTATLTPSHPWFNVVDHGADATGTNESSAQVQAAVDAAEAVGGGTVLFPPGSFLINTPVTVPSNVTLAGSGRRATRIYRTSASNNVILDLSGADEDTYTIRQSIRYLRIDGDGGTNPVVRGYYVADAKFTEVETVYVNGDAWDLVQFWDGRWTNCRWDQAANATSQCAAVRFRNSAASSGFGYSSGDCNENRFTGCIWESFKGHCVWVSQGTNNSATPNGFSFTDCKAESGSQARMEFFYFGNPTQRVTIKNLYMHLGTLDSGASTIQRLIYDANGGYTHYNDVFLNIGASGVLDSVFYTWDNQEHTYTGIRQTGNALNIGLIRVGGGSGRINVGRLLCVNTPTIPGVSVAGGATPSVIGSETTFVSGAGKTTVSDSDWPTSRSCPVSGVSQIVAKNTTDSSYRLFIRDDSGAWKGTVMA